MDNEKEGLRRGQLQAVTGKLPGAQDSRQKAASHLSSRTSKLERSLRHTALS